MARTRFATEHVTADTVVERLVGFTVTADQPGYAQFDVDTYQQAKNVVRHYAGNGATYTIERYEITWTAAEVAERDFCTQFDC